MVSSASFRLMAWGLTGAIGAGFGCGGQSNNHPSPGASGGTLTPLAGAQADNGGAPPGSGGGADAGVTSAGGILAGGTAGGGANGGGLGGSSASQGGDGSAGQSAFIGCGLDATGVAQVTKYTLATSGTKAADATGEPGPWSLEREYVIFLPAGYDSNRHYPLLLEAASCDSLGANVYPLPDLTDFIRVGLSTPPQLIDNTLVQGRTCFDVAEGDDSIDVAFYEALLDKLQTQVCYDPELVFAAGNNSGGRLATELGCKYAGNADGRAIRGTAAHSGGLPTDAAAQLPTCSNAPVAGMWTWRIDDAEGDLPQIKAAIKRTMAVNGCTQGTDYDTASFDVIPIAGPPGSSCRKMLGCPAQYPIVTCELPLVADRINREIINPAFAAFFDGLLP